MPVALITGASRGFGRALALDLASSGWSLVVDGRDGAAVDVLALDLGDASFRALPGDVTDPRHREALIQAAEAFGALDLLVNNASTLGPSPLPTLERVPLGEARRVFEVNVVAPLGLIQGALALLRHSGGVIVSVTSDASVEAYGGWGVYGSSKAALDQVHRVLALEVPELPIYVFDPGDMRTAMHQAAFPGEDISDRPLPETVVQALRRLIDSRSPSGRYTASQWALT